ncbi:MAG: DUF3784 domain-containing protein, partial [Erysipelotrichaceae bacterium]|nr:DUF3784 domain-containing protein [Erysipelotrichaceae bacterium]
ILFSKGKGAFLISGYNTASEKEKAKTDEKKLLSFMSKFAFVLAGCVLLLTAGVFWNLTWLIWVGTILIVAVSIGGVIYANTGSRFSR